MSAIFNPQSLSLLNSGSYLSVSEFERAPIALDLSNLVAEGTDEEQAQSLAEIIWRASSYIDQVVFPDGTGGTLSCSIDTDTGSYPIDRDGYVSLVCRFKPVLAVTDVRFGATPALLQPINGQSMAAIEFGPSGRVLYVPAQVSAGPLFGASPLGRSGRVYAQWSYMDGYPHAVLGADAAASATSLTLGSSLGSMAAPTLGMQPGTQLAVYDSPDGEIVRVASVTSDTVIQLAAPLRFAHRVPAAPDSLTVSALPPSVKEAAILVTAGLIKARGDNSFVLPDDGSGEPQAPKGSSAGDDFAMAMEILEPLCIEMGRA